MDYLIADPVVIPSGAERHYDEQVVRLPHTYFLTDTSVQPAPSPGARSAVGLPEHGFVFACFNTAHKILPEVFSVWMRLLAATPGSVLWLTPGPDIRRTNLRREAAARGVDPERLVYAGYVADRAEYLARPALADLFLDTLPYNAHSTARDALWAGLPVLTCTGRAFASRVCASLVRAAGLPELVTENLADYEAVALRLAHRPEELRQLRERLALGRPTAPIFDMAARCRELEWAYAEMYRLAVEGAPARMIDVPAQAAPN